MNIKETLPAHWESWANIHDTVYVKNPHVKFHMYSGGDSLSIYKLDNALKKGAEVTSYTVKASWGEGSKCHILNNVLAPHGYDIARVVAWLDSLPFKSADKYVSELVHDEIEGIDSVHRYTKSGNRVYSPFALEQLKPLKESPKKWTLPHALKAIANGQFENLKCNGHYTDDYAYDAACNYRQGEIASPQSFIKDIIESPSGWRVWESDGVVRVNCHHFDNNSFRFKLEAPCKSTSE